MPGTGNLPSHTFVRCGEFTNPRTWSRICQFFIADPRSGSFGGCVSWMAEYLTGR